MISFKHHANFSIATLVNRKYTSITNARLGLAANRQGGNQFSYTSFFSNFVWFLYVEQIYGLGVTGLCFLLMCKKALL